MVRSPASARLLQAPSAPPPAQRGPPWHLCPYRAFCLLLSPDPCDLSAPRSAEYLEVMKDRGLVLRTDVFEVLLAQLEGDGGGGGGDGGGAGHA